MLSKVMGKQHVVYKRAHKALTGFKCSGLNYAQESNTGKFLNKPKEFKVCISKSVCCFIPSF